ncbi:MAG: acyl-CoA dehydrogenase [Dehalococcoidia bacterium]|nr:acyl-CoA dehydrogenase [Dehalococcoidia bacterium]MSQ16205.1 acyl-CoA dehydrogenase [Dehalococcoidia bacterium]
MNYFPLTKHQQEWQERAAAIAAKELAPRAEETDRSGSYPKESLDALRREGLWGLRVSKEHGGLGEDLLTSCLVIEELSKKCPSTCMCYKMHLEAAEIVCRIPTPYQVEHFVTLMARGEVFTTVSGGESSGTGDNWTPSQNVSHVDRVAGGYRIDHVRKSYVTSAGKATHYMFRCRVGSESTQSQISQLLVERDRIEWEIVEPWHGLGMRGNNSSPMMFNGVVPAENRLGPEHTVQTLTNNFFRPVVALTYAAAYLGIASGAYETGCQEIARRYPSGSRRFDNAVHQRRMAEMGTQIEAARALLHAAASAFDQGRANSHLPYLQAKVACSEAGVRVTQDLMTIFGGTAFAGRLPFERYFRDARAGVVMGMANDQAYQNMVPMMFPQGG